MNSDVRSVGEFACSDRQLNRIQQMCRRTFLSNLFSVQSDCPHRERFGYGGDIVTTCDALILNYDMVNFYEKATWDWHDAVREDGMLTDTAPFVGIQYCGVGWAMAHPLLQHKLYQYYGDTRLVEQQYDTSRRWLDLVASQTEDHVIKSGLSDHESLVPTPAPQLVTPLYCESARIVSQLAAVLGKKEESLRYARLSESIREAWFEMFVDPETGRVSPATQASHAFALYLKMLPKSLQAERARLLDRRYHCQARRSPDDRHFRHEIRRSMQLSSHGRSDVAFDVVANREFPGWGYMLDNGATTLWEHWALSDNTYSHNHPMFGSVSAWFFNWLGGIQLDAETVAFDRFSIRPQLVEQARLGEMSLRFDPWTDRLQLEAARGNGHSGNRNPHRGNRLSPPARRRSGRDL